jgi:hypothetical protein
MVLLIKRVFYFVFIEKLNKMKTIDVYEKCTIKQKVAMISGILSFALGWGLTIAGFCIPPIGEIADSVLWVLGQALIYTGSVLGLTQYFSAESVKLRHDVDRHLENMERMQIQREKLRQGLDVEEIPDKDEEE